MKMKTIPGMEGAEFSARINADGSLSIEAHFPYSTPTKYQNPQEIYARERSKYQLPAGWHWSERVPHPTAEIAVVAADGRALTADKAILAIAADCLRRVGENAAADFVAKLAA